MAKPELPLDRPLSSAGLRLAGDEAVSGVVHVIRDSEELSRFREGEILVASDVPADWGHLFCLAKGIITETPVMPEHVSRAALEFKFPVITGVPQATSNLRSGDIVLMNVDGTIQRLEERRAGDSPMRVSVPAAVNSRPFANDLQHNSESNAEGTVLAFPVHSIDTRDNVSDGSSPDDLSDDSFDEKPDDLSADDLRDEKKGKFG